jgi:ketosteroid isomerase-like protein
MTPERSAGALARAMLDRFSARDVPAVLDLWADDGVWEFPFAPPGFPPRLEGKEAIRAFQAPAVDGIERLEYHDVEVYELTPSETFVEFRTEARLLSGATYSNRYVARFVARDGLIAYVREWFDPIVLARAFGLDLDA